MEGDPSAIMIGHSWALGARRFDAKAALEVMERVATTPRVESSPRFWSRPGLEAYLKKGIAGGGGEGKDPVRPDKSLNGISGTGGRSQSQTLDYSIADFAVHRLASDLGKPELAARMLRQAQHWKAIVDAKTRRFMAGSYAESNAEAMQFMVPHNLAGLAASMGGAEEALRVFEEKPFSLHNEDNHYIPWAPNWFGAPWVAQRMQRHAFIRQFCILEKVPHYEWKWKPGDPLEFSKLQPKFPGGNDLGAMSSMGFFLALGIFQPITGIDGWAVGAPLTNEITIRRGALGSLTIRTTGGEPLKPYVQSLTVNGKPWTGAWIPGELVPHGKDNVLEFTLGGEPNQQWGLEPKPPSFDAKPWYLGD